MKRLLLPITWVIFSVMVSCNSQKKEVIAIDVLLTLPEAMYAQAVHLNELMLKNYPRSIQLDENHIPHITLLQCFVHKKDIPSIGESLEGLFSMIKDESLVAQEFVYSKDTDESFAMIRVRNSIVLMEIHEKVIELLNPFMVKNGTSDSFVQNPDGRPINEFTLAYVPRFVESYSYENFDPHISLGVAKTEYLDSLATDIFEVTVFQPRNLSVYWLGDSGTAQKLLWEEKL